MEYYLAVKWIYTHKNTTGDFQNNCERNQNNTKEYIQHHSIYIKLSKMQTSLLWEKSD